MTRRRCSRRPRLLLALPTRGNRAEPEQLELLNVMTVDGQPSSGSVFQELTDPETAHESRDAGGAEWNAK